MARTRSPWRWTLYATVVVVAAGAVVASTADAHATWVTGIGLMAGGAAAYAVVYLASVRGRRSK
jgi:hypothetical protein